MVNRLNRPELVEPARTQNMMLSGTAAADHADSLVGRPGIHELTGLDNTRHSIFGVELYATEDGDMHVHLLVADRQAHGIKKFEDWQSVMDEHGHIPVTDYQLPWDTSTTDVLRALFKRFNVVLTPHDFEKHGYKLARIGRGDLGFGDLPAES